MKPVCIFRHIVEWISFFFPRNKLFIDYQTKAIWIISNPPPWTDVLLQDYSPLSCVTTSLWSSLPLLTDILKLNQLVTQPNYCFSSWWMIFLPESAKQRTHPAHLVPLTDSARAHQDIVRLTILMSRRKVVDGLTLDDAERCVPWHDYGSMAMWEAWVLPGRTS